MQALIHTDVIKLTGKKTTIKSSFVNIRLYSNAFAWFEYLISFCFVGIVQIGIFQRNLNVRKPCKSIKQLTAIWFCVSLLLPTFSEKKNCIATCIWIFSCSVAKLNYYLLHSEFEILTISQITCIYGIGFDYWWCALCVLIPLSLIWSNFAKFTKTLRKIPGQRSYHQKLILILVIPVLP